MAGSGGGAAAGARVGGRLAHVADEAKTLSRDGADHALVAAGIGDRLARGVDPGGQRRFRDDAPFPDFLDQIVLGDDAVAVLDQKDQEIEHLRLDSDWLARAGKLAEVGIKHVVGEMKLQIAIPAAAV